MNTICLMYLKNISDKNYNMRLYIVNYNMLNTHCMYNIIELRSYNYLHCLMFI